MKVGFTTLVRALAVCLFLSLLGGYVWYRHDRAKKEEQMRQAMRELTRERAKQGSDFVGPPVEGMDQVIMSSSKNPSRVMLPGSKRGAFEIDGASIDEMLNKSKEGQEQDSVTLPGSKSTDVDILLEDIPIVGRLFKPEEKKPEQKARKE